MKNFPEYESFDGLGLAGLVQRKVVSPEELLEAAIERIEARNPQLNAVIYKMYDQAKESLKDIPQGPFQGVPFLLKDLLADYAGVPLSSGSCFTKNWIPQRDGELVRRFKKSGLIILGKTNVPEFGLSYVTEPELYGPTRNPWDVSRSPGGSSGGSAAAVAAGMVPMAHGNDGGGSIRIPASYCGLFGFKPSRGRNASGTQVMRAWEAMVAEHVLTRSVRDSAAMMDVLAGPEVGSFVSMPAPEHSFLSCLEQPVRKLQIALLEKPFFPASISFESLSGVNRAATLCKQLGHTVDSVSLNINGSEVALAYIIVLAGEMSATLKRISDVMGRKPKHREIELQTEFLVSVGANMKSADFSWATDVLTDAAKHMAHFFQDYDVLMTPTMPSAPPLIGVVKPDFFELSMMEVLSHVPITPLLRKAMERGAAKNFAMIPYTPIFNISGQPAMSVPLFMDDAGLPLGIQFAAATGAEETLFQLAAQLEIAMPWFDNTPEGLKS
ncbi:MAG: amidase [Gammaproteobacteria bacterium]|nr:amidase [Gammaproteobacteria bacterium]